MHQTRIFVFGLFGLVVTFLLASCQIGSSTNPNNEVSSTLNSTFLLSSPAFRDNGLIPAPYGNTGSAGGQNRSIPLAWQGAPPETKSYSLIMVDRHAGAFVHWLIINMPAATTSLPEGASLTAMPAGSTELLNGFNQPGYGGPEPPQNTGLHSYEIDLFALDTDQISISGQATEDQLLSVISSHILVSAQYRVSFEYMAPF
jgi:Raf kinase inhibitor-like YbhB/YbcL family protein